MEERSDIMNSDELKILIETARVEKGISQRELAKQTGISRSTLNDLINGKIKKANIDDLRKIAETLDMSLQKLLKAAGYDEMSLYFNKNKLKDRYYDQSRKDLKELLEQYKESETDLLTFISKKRNKARDIAAKIYDANERLKWIRDGKEGLTLDQIIEELDEALKQVDSIMDKYDYSKLPGRK